MPVVRAKLEEIERTLRADVAQGRMALGALLGDRRPRVYDGWANRGSRGAGARNARGPEANFGAASLGGSGGPIRPIAYGSAPTRRTDAV